MDSKQKNDATLNDLKKTNMKNFLKLVSPDKSETMEHIKERITNRYWLKYSQNIALNVLQQLEELNWSKETFAEKMNISIEEANDIVKGCSDLQMSKLIRIQNLLNINIINNEIL